MAEKKTAQDRALELVAASKTKVERLQKRYDKAKAEYDKVAPLLAEAKEELEFANSHPALRNVANESDVAAETVEAKGLAERPAVEQVPGQQALPVEEVAVSVPAAAPVAEPQEAAVTAPAAAPSASGAGKDPFADFGG